MLEIKMMSRKRIRWRYFRIANIIASIVMRENHFSRRFFSASSLRWTRFPIVD